MAFVATLVTDDLTLTDPTWKDVEQAIVALDGTSLTEVMLAPSPPAGPPAGDHHMGVGGGMDGRYIVYMTEDNMKFWSVEDPPKSEVNPSARMVVGGQEGEYRRSQCVSRDSALIAAREYFERGGRASGLEWESS